MTLDQDDNGYRHSRANALAPPTGRATRSAAARGCAVRARAGGFGRHAPRQHVAACVARHPNAVVAVCGSDHVTYAALAARSARPAAWIDACTPRDAAIAVIARRVCLILDNAHPDERIAEILSDAKSAAVVGDPSRRAGTHADHVLMSYRQNRPAKASRIDAA